MGCLSGIISLRGCSISETPGSVYSLNSLPGISLKAFQDVANSEQKTYLGVWDAINERAEARVKNSILSYMATKYNIKRVQRTVDTNVVGNTSVTANNLFKGIVINNSFDWTNNYVFTAFQNMSIDKIRFWYDGTTAFTDVDVQFFDYVTKEILYTKNIIKTELVEGWNEFSILKTFNAPILGIGYSLNIPTVSYNIDKTSAWWGSCITSCYGLWNCGYIKGFTSEDDSIDSQLTYGSNAYGLQAIVTIGCSYDAAICSNRLLFAEAMWYLLGSEFMTEIMYSERINFMTTVKRDQAVELKAHYDLQFEEALKNGLNGLKFECDECLQCNSLVQSFTQLP